MRTPLPLIAAFLCVAGALANLAPASAAPAQEPLLLRSVQVVPNIMLTLDDSPSMTSVYMAKDTDTRMHPAELGASSGIIPTITGNNYVAQMRSSMSNAQYYNPEVRYLPWATSDGSLMANADPKSVWIRPHPTAPSGGTVDLTVTDVDVKTNWCTVADAYCSITTLAFTPAVYFRYVNSAWERVEIVKTSSFPKGAARTDCVTNATTCTQQEELQNFANWFAYYRDRVRTAIAGTTFAFSKLPSSARVGYGSLNANVTPVTIDGGGTTTSTIVRGIREFSGADREALFNWIYAFKTRGYTPTKRAVAEVGQYFQRTDNKGPWGAKPGTDDATEQVSCRRNFHILVTDGVWNNSYQAPSWTNADFDSQTGPLITGPGGQSYQYTPSLPYASTLTWGETEGTFNSLADITHYYWSRDLRPDLPNNLTPNATNEAFWQHLVHYMVGLGVTGINKLDTDLPLIKAGKKSWSTSRIDDVWHAAVNSRGEYFSAAKPEEFGNRLASIFDAISVSASLGGVSASGQYLRAGTRKYVPQFTSDSWTGELFAFELDARGNASDIPVWTANARLPAPRDRNIVFWKDATSGARPFTWDELTPAQQTALGSADVLDYLRGDKSREGKGFRTRKLTLGDMVNSQPLYIRDMVDQEYDFLAPGTPGRDSYRKFLEAMKKRVGAVAIGANDGMLHFFQDSGGALADDGKETFAFIPNAVMGQLANLANPGYVHRYYVDGPVAEHHAYLGGAWRSVLLGTAGAGARAAFALNVSKPDAMDKGSVMWELNSSAEPDLGWQFAAPAVGLSTTGKWIALIGNGSGGASNKAQLFVVDLESGQVLRKIDAGSAATGNGLGGVKPLLNANRQIVGAYAGDALGKVWRFDLESAKTGNWGVGNGGKPIFQAASSTNTAQPIVVAPEYKAHPNGGQLVIVATGRLVEQADATDSSQQSVYGFWDQAPGAELGATISRSSLVAQEHGTATVVTKDGLDQTYYSTSSNTPDWRRDKGWYLDLTLERGQRTIYPLSFLFGQLRLETIYMIGVKDQCQSQLSGGINYLLDPLTGGQSKTLSLDTNGDGVINGSDIAAGAYKTKLDGKDTVVLSGASRGEIISSGKYSKSIMTSREGVRRTWRQVYVK
jgi:type IV pilus assembly protein PilY1